MKKGEWDRYRKKVLIPEYEDRMYCEVCGRTGALGFHHIVFRSQGGKNELNNIILLCHKCHEKAHRSREFRLELERMRGL